MGTTKGREKGTNNVTKSPEKLEDEEGVTKKHKQIIFDNPLQLY